MLTSPGGAQKHHIVAGGDEVQGAQVGDGVALEPTGVIKVELFQGFSSQEAGGADATLTTMGLAGRDFALQAGGQVFLMAPVLRASPLGEPTGRLAQRGRLECAGRRARH